MDKRFLFAGAIFGVLGVVFGAFATHGLAPLLDAPSLTSFETGIRYQIYHGLLLLILGGMSRVMGNAASAIFYLLCLGILLFSGSIYLLATNEFSFFDFRSFALITPVGGSLLIAAWIVLLVGIYSLKKK